MFSRSFITQSAIVGKNALSLQKAMPGVTQKITSIVQTQDSSNNSSIFDEKTTFERSGLQSRVSKRLFSTKPSFTITETKIEDLPKHNRPVSPHLTIYRLPMPAIMSITHRATGIALGLGVFAMAGAALYGGGDATVYINELKTAFPELMVPAKFCVSFPIIYHSMAGARHLYWDTSLKGIEIKNAESTGWFIVGLSTIISIAISFVEISSQ